MIRRQLPAYSPVLPLQLAGAGVDVLTGPEEALQAFERELRDRFSADLAVLTSSGTHALQLALMATARPDSGTRPAVALPAYSCFDLVTAAVGARVPVAFYDVEPGMLTPDARSLREALRGGARAAVVANLHGFPLDWDAARAVCADLDAWLVEDAAQGLGSSWRGRPGGSFGDLTVLSFGRGKGWSGGGGGAVLARGDAAGRLAELAVTLEGPGRGSGVKAFGVSAAVWLVGRPSLYAVPAGLPGLRLGETVYKDPTPVTGMSSAHAAIAGRHWAPSLDAVEERRARARRWDDVLSGHALGADVTACRPSAGGTSGYLRYPALASSTDARSGILERLAGMGAAPGYPCPLPRLPASGALVAREGRAFPGAEELAGRLFTLPTHPRVSNADFSAVARR